MTKALEIYPEKLFAKGQIDFTPIPVNAYSKSLAEEKKLFSKDDFVTIYHDMMVLRTFETIINEIKLKGEYQGVKYNHAGPAHLSLGQECAAVGQAYALDVNTFVKLLSGLHGALCTEAQLSGGLLLKS